MNRLLLNTRVLTTLEATPLLRCVVSVAMLTVGPIDLLFWSSSLDESLPGRLLMEWLLFVSVILCDDTDPRLPTDGSTGLSLLAKVALDRPLPFS